jgi:hypothetical protein
MKSKVLIATTIILMVTGCSTKSVKKPISSNPTPIKEVNLNKKDDINIHKSDIEMKLDRAVLLQNQKQYIEAIELYYSIIKNNDVSRDVLKLAYINMFECQLVSNKSFRISDVKRFLEIFGKEKEALMEFEILHILNQAKYGSVDDKIEKWSGEYRGYRLKNWSFQYIDDWANNIERPDIRTRLKRYIEIFKKFL